MQSLKAEQKFVEEETKKRETCTWIVAGSTIHSYFSIKFWCINLDIIKFGNMITIKGWYVTPDMFSC